MRIVSWNLAHQTREDPIPAALIPALSALRPDLLILNEFVDGPSRDALRSDLKALELHDIHVSQRVGTNNQVLIASSVPLDPGDLRGPALIGGAAESNFLHVRMEGGALEVVGVRAPAYMPRQLNEYWTHLSALIRSTKDRSIIWIGDLNGDPDLPSSTGGKCLAKLREEGWQLPRATGAWSFHKGTRIDHVLASPSVPTVTAEYLASIGGVTVASGDRETRVSDHAALLAIIGPDASSLAS